jgi:hypothetical protein
VVATGFRYGAKASVVINAVDLSAYSDSAGLNITVAASNTTTFGNTWETFIEGLAGAKFDIKGNYDPTTTSGPAAALTALIGTGSHTCVFSPAGTVSLELKRSVSVILTNYVETSPVAGQVTFTAAFTGTGAVTFAAN